MGKAINISIGLLNITSAALFVSSFFVEDNKKAVNMRWGALGALALSWGVKVVGDEIIKKA